jgi:hypothetical protein
MGDREIKQFNRVLFKKFGNRTQELHLSRLHGSGVKAVVDTSSPPVFAHMADRRRAKQRWSDEQARIEFSNQLLLQRMRTIMAETQNKQFIDIGQPGCQQGGAQSMLLSGAGAAGPGEVARGSLNRDARVKEMRRILHENESLLQRIQARGPTYSVAEWEKEHVLHEKQLQGMGRFPYRSSNLPPSVLAELNKPKAPLKRYGTSRYPVTNEGEPIRPFVFDGDEEEGGRGRSPSPKRLSKSASAQSLGKTSAARVLAQARARAAAVAAAVPVFPPVEVSLQVENLLDHLLPSDGSKLGPKEKTPLPRVLVYLRNAATGEYVIHSESRVFSAGKGPLTTFKGATTIPGIDTSPEAQEAGADRRVRVALFAPTDPAFLAPFPSHPNGLRVPADNTHLLGEARFSLAHFLAFPKQLYKLKVLKHGLPIAGPNFATQNSGAGAASGVQLHSDEEIARRRKMLEAILVLQHTNRAEPFPEQEQPHQSPPPAMEEHKQADERPSSSPNSPAKEQPAPEAKEAPAAAAAAAAPRPPRLALKFAASGLGGGGDPDYPDPDAANPTVFLFAENAAADGSGGGEVELGRSERFDASSAPAGSLPSEPTWLRSIELGEDITADPQRHLRVAVYETSAEGERGALLGERKITVADLRAQVHDGQNQADPVWSVQLLESASSEPAAAAAADPSSSSSTPQRMLMLRVEDPSCSRSSDAVWGGLAVAAREAALSEAAAAEREDKLYRFLENAANNSLWTSDSYRPVGGHDTADGGAGGGAHKSFVVKKLLDTVHGDDQFLYAYFAAAKKEGYKYLQADTLLAAVAAGLETLVAASALLLDYLSSPNNHLLPHPSGGAGDKAVLDDSALEAMLADAGLPLSPLAPVCARHRDEALRRLESLEKQGLTFSHADHLAVALRKEGDRMAEAEHKALADAEAEGERRRVAAAIKIQAAQRGRAVRQKKDQTYAMLRERNERARVEREQRAAEAKAAAALAEEKARAEEARAQARREAEEAAAKQKAAQDAAIAAAELDLAGKTFSVSLRIGCRHLPLAPAGAAAGAGHCHPMVALYCAESAASFAFVSQSERQLDATNPVFAERLLIPALKLKGEKQYMFSVYNVGDEAAIREEDVQGTALMAQKDLAAQVVRLHAKLPWEILSLPIVHEGALLASATLVVAEIAYTVLDEAEAKAAEEATVAEAASAAAALAEAGVVVADAAPTTPSPPPAAFDPSTLPSDQLAIFVQLKDLVLPPGVTQCNALAALYTKDSDTPNFNYVSQTDPVMDSLSPSFAQPLVMPRPLEGSGVDTDCMLNVYNHVSDEAEVSDAAALGACLFSLTKLTASPTHSLRVPLIKDGTVRGAVVLKSHQGAMTPAPTRPSTAATAATASASAAASSGAGAKAAAAASSKAEADKMLGEFDLHLACKGLPLRPRLGGGGALGCEPMIALYGQDPATQEFSYVGQTEKQNSPSGAPVFVTSIRLDETSGGGADGDRPLMLMCYDVLDESNIAETDQIGTCALTWKYLREQARLGNNAIELPFLGAEGQIHPTAVVIVGIKRVPTTTSKQ